MRLFKRNKKTDFFDSDLAAKLPEEYLDFFNACQTNRNSVYTGTDLRNEKPDLNKWAIELIQESNIPNFLTEEHFVFMMHQGYMFWYFKLGEDNPDVFYYHEGWEAPRNEGAFTDFISQYEGKT